MALTHAEFLRCLPAASAGMSCRIEGDRVLLRDPPRRVEIRLAPEEARSIGSLRLPQTQVEVRLDGFSPQARGAFLRRFDLAYQRGGG
jgi:hypothetical protein